MKSYKSYSDSEYLKKEDFPEPETLTISEVREEEVTAPGKETKLKLVIYFEERQKGLVLNLANGAVLEAISGTDDPAKWIGIRVRVFCDPTVMFGGQQVGGIRLARVRPPPQQRGAPVQSSPVPAKPVFPSPSDSDDEARQTRREAEAQLTHDQQRIQHLEQELEAIKRKALAKGAHVNTETDENGVPY